MRPELLFPFIFLLALVLAVFVGRWVLLTLARSIYRAWKEPEPPHL